VTYVVVVVVNSFTSSMGLVYIKYGLTYHAVWCL